MTTIYGPEPDPEPLSAVSDLAGTPVVDVDAVDVGSVFGALAEVESGLIRYFDIALGHAPKHVLVPVGHARVDREEGGARLKLRAARRDDLDEIPTYDPAADDEGEAFERSVLTSLGRLFYGERYYAHPAYDHRGLYAGRHPIVSPAEDGGETAAPGGEKLVAMSRLRGYRVADGVPDVRGWEVVASDAAEVGRVLDLVVDVEAETVRYIMVGGDGATEVALLPVGYARIEPSRDRIELPVLDGGDVAALTFHDPATPIERPEEERVRSQLEQRLSGRRRFDRADFRPPAPKDS